MNFDISKLSIDLFNFLREKDRNIWCGISNKNGSKKIFYRKKLNMLNTLNEKIAKIHFRNGFNHKLMPEYSLDSNIFNFSIGGNPRTPFKDDFHECGLGVRGYK